MIERKMSFDFGTSSIAQYIKSRGISIAAVSRATNITIGKLQRSISDEKRPLRTDEFLKICKFLDIEPMQFYRAS